MIEVERKYRLPSAMVNHIRSRLSDVSDGVRQIDTIYLQDASSFADVDKVRGYAVLRTRESGGQTTLTAKRRRTGSSSIESEIHTDSVTAAQFMQVLRWNKVTHVAKTRSQAEYEGVTVALDDVDQLGLYVELEVLVESDDETPRALALIDQAALSLGLSTEWIETRKYDELVPPAQEINL